MKAGRVSTLLGGACCLTLVSLSLMAWSVVDPRPGPVMVAMSVGQALGTLSLLSFVAVVIDDLRRSALGGTKGGERAEDRGGE